ncbi:MAG: hypothetical protein A4E57_02117 [Syntrophorhabdaceae bacterium PtaU1.Bin034]|jgi:hypothetical protein|nr:MAG: hypothetical protein A4E57_02117 [Syntrophorhabdaceae bacterium PtaU1.Bin034]
MRLTEIFFGKEFRTYLKADEPETRGLLTFLFIGRKATFKSPYPAKIAASKLKARIIESPLFFRQFLSEDAMLGKASVDRVRLVWLRRGVRNSFNPIFIGRFKDAQTGSELEGVYRLPRTITGFTCLWFSGIFLGTILFLTVVFSDGGLKALRFPLVLGPLLFVLFAGLMIAGGIGLVAFAKRVAKDSFRNMSEAISKSIG